MLDNLIYSFPKWTTVDAYGYPYRQVSSAKARMPKLVRWQYLHNGWADRAETWTAVTDTSLRLRTLAYELLPIRTLGLRTFVWLPSLLPGLKFVNLKFVWENVRFDTDWAMHFCLTVGMLLHVRTYGICSYISRTAGPFVLNVSALFGIDIKGNLQGSTEASLCTCALVRNVSRP